MQEKTKDLKALGQAVQDRCNEIESGKSIVLAKLLPVLEALKLDFILESK